MKAVVIIMEQKTKSVLPKVKYISILIKSILLIIGVIGQFYTAGSMSFMSNAHFMFFTNLSNLWIMAIVAVFLGYDIIHVITGCDKPQPTNYLYAAKFVCTVAITLTFLVFSVLLIPQLIANGQSAYIFSMSNICVHNAVPMLAILDFCLFDYRYRTNKGSFVLGIILPLAYVCFVMMCSVKGIMFGDMNFPYFFFDYIENGWFTIEAGRIGVAYWIVILAAVVLIIGLILIAIKNKVAKNKT